LVPGFFHGGSLDLALVTILIAHTTVSIRLAFFLLHTTFIALGLALLLAATLIPVLLARTGLACVLAALFSLLRTAVLITLHLILLAGALGLLPLLLARLVLLIFHRFTGFWFIKYAELSFMLLN
jgi:hypothetical protein